MTHTKKTKLKALGLAGAGLTFFLGCSTQLAGQTSGRALSSPLRIAGGAEIVVTDFAQRAVFGLHKKTLQVLWSHPIEGAPSAVGRWKDLVFVGNETTQNVEVYRLGKAAKGSGQKKSLSFLYNLGHVLQGSLGPIIRPADMALDEGRQLAFVLDGAAAKVKVFTFSGNFIETLPAADQPSLAFPAAITVDPVRREILISDWSDFDASQPRIMIYDYSGFFLEQINAADLADPYKFPRPQGLWTDRHGHIFLVDALLNKVVVFNRTSPYGGVKTLGSFGAGPGQLRYPLDVVVDRKSGDVFVTNNSSGRVEVYRGGGKLK